MSEFLAREGQFLLPMPDLITQAEMALEELIDADHSWTLSETFPAKAQEGTLRHKELLRWHRFKLTYTILDAIGQNRV